MKRHSYFFASCFFDSPFKELLNILFWITIYVIVQRFYSMDVLVQHFHILSCHKLHFVLVYPIGLKTFASFQILCSMTINWLIVLIVELFLLKQWDKKLWSFLFYCIPPIQYILNIQQENNVLWIYIYNLKHNEKFC